MPMKIAVIDNWISPLAVKKLTGNEIISRRVVGDNCIPENRKTLVYSHGSVCLSILTEVCTKQEVTGVSIAGEDGQIHMNELHTALGWCAEEKFDLICMSLGTFDWRDTIALPGRLLALAESGTLLVAAGANDGSLSFPSAYPWVIGVQFDKKGRGICRIKGMKNGVDISVGNFGSRVLEQMWEKSTYFETCTNSMAAPYFAGWVAKNLPGKTKAEILGEFPLCEIPAQRMDLSALEIPAVKLIRLDKKAQKLLHLFRKQNCLAVLVSGSRPARWEPLCLYVKDAQDLNETIPCLKHTNILLLEDINNVEVDLSLDCSKRSVEEIYGAITSFFL